MTLFKPIALAAALSLSAAAQAQTNGFVPCEGEWSAQVENLYIGENGEGIRTFYDGAVILLRIDTGEPAAASGGVIVMMWPGGETEGPPVRSCWVNWGHGMVDVDATQSSYDPATGLTLSIPTSRYNPGDGEMIADTIRFRVNVGAGSLTALN